MSTAIPDFSFIDDYDHAVTLRDTLLPAYGAASRLYEQVRAELANAIVPLPLANIDAMTAEQQSDYFINTVIPSIDAITHMADILELWKRMAPVYAAIYGRVNELAPTS